MDVFGVTLVGVSPPKAKALGLLLRSGGPDMSGALLKGEPDGDRSRALSVDSGLLLFSTERKYCIGDNTATGTYTNQPQQNIAGQGEERLCIPQYHYRHL